VEIAGDRPGPALLRVPREAGVAAPRLAAVGPVIRPVAVSERRRERAPAGASDERDVGQPVAVEIAGDRRGPARLAVPREAGVAARGLAAVGAGERAVSLRERDGHGSPAGSSDERDVGHAVAVEVAGDRPGAALLRVPREADVAARRLAAVGPVIRPVA